MMRFAYSNMSRPIIAPRTIAQKNFRYKGVSDFLDNEHAVLLFAKGVEVDGISPQTNVFKKTYSFTKKLRGFKFVDLTHSFATYELFADTKELGRITIVDNYIDKSNLLEHKTRILSVINDDDLLVTRETIQTYIELDESAIPIKIEAFQSPYTFLRERIEYQKQDSTLFRKYIVQDYMKNNGEIYSVRKYLRLIEILSPADL